MSKRPSGMSPDRRRQMTYLRIRGRLHADMTFTPRAGLESAVPHREAGHPDYQLVLLDANDKPLASVAPQVSDMGCGMRGAPEDARVSGYIALHPDAAAYELRKGDIRIHRQPIAKSPPPAPQVDATPSGTGVTLRWKNPGKVRLTYSVVAEIDKGPRVTLARDIDGSEHTIVWTETPLAGSGRILLVANDGVRASTREAYRFKLPEASPTVHILSPGDGAHMFGQPLSLVGACLDGSGTPIETAQIEWRIDKEPVAKGSLMAVAYDPPEGRHELTLVAHLDGREVSVSQPLEVAPPDDDYRLWRDAVAALAGR